MMHGPFSCSMLFTFSSIDDSFKVLNREYRTTAYSGKIKL
jgi:hypothetical protein